jgi:outer membrane protein assembly factor BamB
MKSLTCFTSAALIWCIGSTLGTTAVGEDWTQFRGPEAGVVTGGQLPLEWGADTHVIWKKSLPGVGWSQPVVVGSRIIVTTAESDAPSKPDPNNRAPGVSGFAIFFGAIDMEPPKVTHHWKVLCLDAASGDIVWEKTAREGRPTIKIHTNNTYASETPVTDGERLYAYFGMTGLYCYDLSGNQLWEKDLGAYPTQYGWGTGSSPLLFENLIYIQCDNDRSSFVVALDKKSGDEVWRANREEKSNWSTPYLWKNKLRTELIVAGGSAMQSYDPKTGTVLWTMKGSGRTATTPVGDEDLLFVDSYDRMTGNVGFLAAVRAGAIGDISLTANESTNEHVAWRTNLRGTRIASPMLYQNCLYVLANGSGIVYCLDVHSGQEHYRQRLPGAAAFTASPLANDGKVYCLDQNGQTAVIAAGPQLKVLATNKLDEMTWASPAIAGDKLLIRTLDHLYCIGISSQ